LIWVDLGKNRLLEMYYMFVQMLQAEDDSRTYKERALLTSEERNQVKRNLRLLQTQYGGPDYSEIDTSDVALFRTYVDTILTLYQLERAGIPNTVFNYDQAKMLALYRGLAIEVGQAEEIKEELDAIDNDAEKKVMFNIWVLNRMCFPIEVEHTPRPMRIKSILASFKQWSDKDGSLKKRDLIVLKRDKDIDSSITNAHRIVVYLASKLNINLEKNKTCIEEIKASLDL